MREEASIGRHVQPGGVLLYAEAGGAAWIEAFIPATLKRRCVEKAKCVRNVRSISLGDAIGVDWTDARGRDWQLPLAGAHNAGNGMLAVWVAEALGVGREAIRAGLLTAQGPEMRQQVIEVGAVTIVNDAYNANPESMLASLGTFAQLTARAQRRVAILGDMRELGEATSAAHDEVLAAACGTAGVERVITIGPSFGTIDAPAGHPVEQHLDLDAEAVHAIVGALRAGDAVLLKGSRGMQLERLVPAITTRFAGPRVQTPGRGVAVGGAGPA
jgi:UDP-N-acetylmuramyl pentapeptide synthase